MIICGIKLTHDGGVALIDDGELKFSIEMEKIDNNPRYSDFRDVDRLPEILEKQGYHIGQIDKFVIDGWHGSGADLSGPSLIELTGENAKRAIEVAIYHEKGMRTNVLERYTFNNKLPVGGSCYAYSSYMHVAGHITSAYFTSPFADRGESAYVLTWDGGQYPRLYYFDANTQSARNLGHLFLFHGNIYSILAQYFGPYKKTASELGEESRVKTIEGFFGGHSVAGKIMSYIAYGRFRPELITIFENIMRSDFHLSNEFSHLFSQKARQLISSAIYPDEDVLLTFHLYLEQLLLSGLKEKVEKYHKLSKSLCFAGGCALNIKWNSAIRSSGLFKEVYIPPFPNDSGSAIGVACCELLFQTGQSKINWTVYSGPVIEVGECVNGWIGSECPVRELARLLYRSGEPVVFLNGCSELGPRALGNRSIIASPVSPRMKDVLNKIKKREPFRPVAPICLEEDAPDIFDPGTRDPYMLFDHKVKEDWKERIPAVCHIDGTARLQTVNKNDNKTVFELLTEFKRISGLPVLCNTSANENGSGFFPDVESAIQWGRLNYVWSNNTLYTNPERVDLK